MYSLIFLYFLWQFSVQSYGGIQIKIYELLIRIRIRQNNSFLAGPDPCNIFQTFLVIFTT